MPEDISKEMPKDISKRTIAILLIVAIILSVTSTWIAVRAAYKAKGEVVTEDSGSAQVSVNVVAPPESVQEEAQVSVNVVEKE